MKSPVNTNATKDRDTSQRLYIKGDLEDGQPITLTGDNAHYLKNVLRMKTGELLRLFNGKDGEWRGTLASQSRRDVFVEVGQRLRYQGTDVPLTLCCAPIKKTHFDNMIEKATELGVTTIQPILTSRTQIREVNVERCSLIAKEAAEQSERLSLPTIHAPLPLDKFLTGRNATIALMVCAEWGDALSAPDTFKHMPKSAQILTGPEGGFTDGEFTLLRNQSNVNFIRLGPRILRADTAAIAALTLWQALCGDWHNG
jgi:16S rRNA (uracil1498-N3)-methyltransferase